MIHRGLLLADGPSDEPLAGHVEALFAEHGCTVRIVAPDLARLAAPPGRRVEDRLRIALEIDQGFGVIVVHRDAEGQPPTVRVREIDDAMAAVSCSLPHVPVIPVRMTEAWLLLDEPAIRRVAGRPSGRTALGLPKRRDVERVPDPKAVLQDALSRASGRTGRRLAQFKQQFGHHRRQLLSLLDPNGPVTELVAWKDLLASVNEAARALGS